MLIGEVWVLCFFFGVGCGVLFRVYRLGKGDGSFFNRIKVLLMKIKGNRFERWGY